MTDRPQDEGTREADDGGVSEALTAETAKKTRTLSRDIILNFNAAVRVAQFHSIDNKAAQSALDRVLELLASLFELSYDVSLLYYSKDFYVNDVRIKSSRTTYEAFDGLARFLESRGVGGFSFPALPPREAISTFIVTLNEATAGADSNPFQQILERLEEAGITELKLTPFAGDDLEDLPLIDKETFIKQAYFRGITVLHQLFEDARRRKPLALKNVKRVVQNYVDVLTDETQLHTDLLLLLTQVKNWRGYLCNHAINTSILSVGLGAGLGFEREALRELGMAAALADIGNAVLPGEVLDDAGALTREGQEVVRGHPLAGVSLIASYQQTDRVVIKAALACLAHHRGFDGDGYPPELVKYDGIYPQIIAICDRYDAMTTPRPHRPRPLAPPRALTELAKLAGSELNPLLVKAFVNWVGDLPTGTAVVLDSGEVGVVVRAQTGLRRHQTTRIRVLLTAAGALAPDEIVEVGDGTGPGIKEVVTESNEELWNLTTGVGLRPQRWNKAE